MKQVIQNFKSGELSIQDVPTPVLHPNGVLVRTHYSLISVGTESGTVRLAQASLLGKARSRPDLLRKVMQVVKTDGLLTAFQASMRQLNTPVPLGYSCAGKVISVGADVNDLKVGDRVTCGGGGYANHAEVNFVPRNLCVKVPERVRLRDAAFTTVGSIAMQSVRVAQVTLGENVVVIGLGLVGLLTVQVLKAAGCNVFGVDLDSWKIQLARELGADCAALRSEGNLLEQIHAFTAGAGADVSIITAAAPTNDPVVLAGQVARYRGRVVVVGRIDMSVPREHYLYKELEFCSSLAYGPGTGDRTYEEHGVDYPIGYVRWTENRNMQSFVHLLETGGVRTEKMITHEFAVEEAPMAYGMIANGKGEKYIGVLLSYDVEREVETRIVVTPTIRRRAQARVGVGVIGAGSFATNFLMPALAKVPTAYLKGIASATGVSARDIARKYSFEYCRSDPAELFADNDIHCVFILTRHNTHAPLTIQALEAGKDVFVEKPLAMTKTELAQVVQVQRRTEGRVMVGFNRRFAPLAKKLKDFFGQRGQPMSIIYRMNAGFTPRTHWLHDPVEGGGRIIGEACHFIDFLLYLTGARPQTVYAHCIAGEDDVINQDNTIANFTFDDGSIGSMAYLAGGDKSYSRERVEVYCDQSIGVLEDFRRLKLVRGGRVRKHNTRLVQDKGHRGEIEAFINAIAEGRELPFSFDKYATSMLATFQVLESIATGKVAHINLFEIVAADTESME